MQKNTRIFHENRLVFFGGVEGPTHVEKTNDKPSPTPKESGAFDPDAVEKRKEERNGREEREDADKKEEQEKLGNIEKQMLSDDIDSKELQEAEAFLGRARETLPNQKYKEVYDEATKELGSAEKIALYKDSTVFQKSVEKYTSFKASDIAAVSLKSFAGNIVFSSLEPIDLGETPPSLNNTVDAIRAERETAMTQQEKESYNQAKDKMKARVAAFLQKPENVQLVQEMTQSRNAKEKQLRAAVGVMKLGNSTAESTHINSFFKSEDELNNQIGSEIETMTKDINERGDVQLKITSSGKDKTGKLSLKLTPKNETQYAKVLEIATKQIGSNVRETKAFMKKPSIDIEKANPNKVKVLVAQLRDAKLD